MQFSVMNIMGTSCSVPVFFCALFLTVALSNVSVRVSWLPPNSDVCQKNSFVLDQGDQVSFEESGYVQVDVTDSGEGLSAQEVKQVFGEGVQ